MSLKSVLFRGARAAGVTTLVARSRWRRARLLILCYHGVSLQDEHEADPELYVPPAHLRGRLAALRAGGYVVLPLGEAVARLRAGTLPPRSVALTFDDGTRDFAEVAVPILAEFDAPATVYLTTYYCDHALPVFNTAARYLLWRGRDRGVDVGPVLGLDRRVPIATPAERAAAWDAIAAHMTAAALDAAGKDALLRRLSAAVGVDHDAFLATGMFQQMTPAQVRDLPRPLVDVQLHTHRHRTPRDEALFRREIVENRDRIAAYEAGAAPPPVHFCYPSGDYRGEFLRWLPALGVETATTTVPDIATADSHPLLLPRFIDTCAVDATTFGAWVAGLAALLPKRRAHRLDPARLGA